MSSAVSLAVRPNLGRPAQRAFTLMLLSYWLLLYTTSTSGEVERGSFLYALYIGPVLLFASVFAIPALLRRGVTLPLFLLGGFAVVVVAVALVRADMPTVSSTVILVVVLIIVSSEQLAPPPALLNLIFLASIPLSLATYLAGTNIYGIVPGMSLDEALWWRISLFPVVPESAFFSAIILLVNLTNRQLAMRRTCIVLAIYFLFFSGLRSALIGTLLALAYDLAVRRSWIRQPLAKMVCLAGATLVFVGSLLMSELVVLVPGLSSEFLNVYLFRSEAGLDSADDLARSIYRGWLWTEHFRIAATNPWFGVGTNDFAMLADDTLAVGVGSGSESFLTGLYARVGLTALLFVAFLVVTIWRQVKAGRHLPSLVALLLLVAMLAYGSFLVPYNFVFLVLMGLLCGSTSQQGAAVGLRPRHRATARWDAA